MPVTNRRVARLGAGSLRSKALSLRTTQKRYRGHCAAAACALCVLVASSCGSLSSIDSRGADASTPSSDFAPAPVLATNDCGVPPEFGSTPMSTDYPLRGDMPESDAPIDTSIKRPIVSTPQAAVDEVVQRFKFSDIKVARLGGRPDAAAIGGPWLYVLVSVPSGDGQWRVRAEFVAATIMGEAAELAVTSNDLADAIGGIVLGLQTPDCQIISEDANSTGPRAAGQVFTATRNAADVDFAKQVLSKYGATPVSVAILGGASVLMVTASIPDVKTMNENIGQMFPDLQGSPLRFASVFLRLQTSDGEDVAIFAGSQRIAAGSVWVQPGLESTFGIIHG